MRDFHGKAAEVTPASLDDSFALVAAVDRYPDWCPGAVRAVDVLERGADGYPAGSRMRSPRASSARRAELSPRVSRMRSVLLRRAQARIPTIAALGEVLGRPLHAMASGPAHVMA
jgi:hypothetical protein